MVVILKDTDKRTKHREIISLCWCECGNIFETVKRNVKRGIVQSCGCGRSKDLVNKRFEKIVVISKTENRSKYNNSVIWKCKCDCGKEIFLSTGELLHPNRKSCGCFKENMIQSCKKRGGKNHHWYNHSLTDKDREESKNRPERYEFYKKVFDRDNYTCVVCNKRGGDLNAHHLNSYHWDKDNRDNIDNGVTLCKTCHNEFHKIYGQKFNTKEQFENFLRNNK